MTEIVIIGAAIIDVLARPVGADVFAFGSAPMDEICMSTGGDALNEALILARAGKKVRLETVIGDDEAGRFLAEQCRKDNIIVESCQIRKGMTTGINIVLVDERGERHFLTNPEGTLRKLTLEDIHMPFDTSAKILCFASIFVFPHIKTPELVKIFSQAKSQGMAVCADMTKRKYGETLEDMKEALELVDYLIPNEEEACLLTETQTAKQAADKLIEAGVKNVIIKCGKRGCLVKNREETFEVPAVPGVRCIDTTGAGDSFTAGFLYALSAEKTLRECAQLANEWGARAVQSVGAVTWTQSEKSSDDRAKNS